MIIFNEELGPHQEDGWKPKCIDSIVLAHCTAIRYVWELG